MFGIWVLFFFLILAIALGAFAVRETLRNGKAASQR